MAWKPDWLGKSLKKGCKGAAQFGLLVKSMYDEVIGLSHADRVSWSEASVQRMDKEVKKDSEERDPCSYSSFLTLLFSCCEVGRIGDQTWCAPASPVMDAQF